MKIKLNNVRLSFPALFEAKSFKGSEAKFGAAFILDKEKHADTIKTISDACDKLAKEKFGGKVPKKCIMCLHDGEEKEDIDGYGEDVMFITSSNRKRPQVIDRSRSPIVEEDDIVYAGCYVNALVSLWVQDNDFGKRVNAQLTAVQYVKDGESFGEPPVKVEDEFEDLSEDEESVL